MRETGNVPSRAGVSDPRGFQLDRVALGLPPSSSDLPGWGLASSHPGLVYRKAQLHFHLVPRAVVKPGRVFVIAAP